MLARHRRRLARWLARNVLLVAALALFAVVLVRAAAPTVPVLSENERLRVANVNLMQQLAEALKDADLCRGQLAAPRFHVNEEQVEQATTNLKRMVEHDHPGYTWDPASGTFAPVAKTKEPPR